MALVCESSLSKKKMNRYLLCLAAVFRAAAAGLAVGADPSVGEAALASVVHSESQHHSQRQFNC